MRSNAQRMFWAIVMEGALLTTAGVACSAGEPSDDGVDSGAEGAKLAGAGGGGVVIALASDVDAVVEAATAGGFRAFVTASHAAT